MNFKVPGKLLSRSSNTGRAEAPTDLYRSIHKRRWDGTRSERTSGTPFSDMLVRGEWMLSNRILPANYKEASTCPSPRLPRSPKHAIREIRSITLKPRLNSPVRGSGRTPEYQSMASGGEKVKVWLDKIIVFPTVLNIGVSCSSCWQFKDFVSSQFGV